MYRKLYGQKSSSNSNVKKGKSKKRKQPTKVIKYGPPRIKETSWARDFRMMVKSIMTMNALVDAKSDDEDEVILPTIEEEEKTALCVKEVNLHIEENTKAHHTDMYECTQERGGEFKDLDPDLVLRRGQEFKVTVTFNRQYNIEQDDLLFCLTIGKDSKTGMEVELELTEDNIPPATTENWHARIHERKGNDLVVKLSVPSNCVIGEWDFKISTFSDMGSERKQFIYTTAVDIIIICNPWCTDDDVYLEDDSDRNEYVLNDTGFLYIGSYRQIGSRDWCFGQFQDSILETSLHILRRGFGDKISSEMGNPVKILRAISNIVNNDVLWGKWSGDYSGGKKPTAWSGSPNILKQFNKSTEMVKFGQCWVFSGVSTTICRALGIPCRSVTCFASAHDTDMSTTIDTIFDKDMNRVEEECNDSVWNFHVWNEGFMRRRDLGPGYDGWQIFDATPQEASDGEYQCGPAPLSAIKRGECNMPYDSNFVFAEVNGDRISWKKINDYKYEVLYVEKSSVGKCISTSDPKSTDDNPIRRDLTNDYKPKEGSPEEREVMMEAARHSKSKRNQNRDPPHQDVEIAIDAKDGIMLGYPLPVVVTLKLSDCNEIRTISKLKIDATAKTYTNMRFDTMDVHEAENIILKPNEKAVEVRVDVKPEDYLKILVKDQSFLEFKVTALVEETHKIHVKCDDGRFRKPSLKLKVQGKPHKDEPFKLIASFPNCLQQKLTNCILDLSGVEGGYMDEGDFFYDSVGPDAEINLEVEVKVHRSGIHTITGTFICDQMDDITGRVKTELSK